MKSGGSPILGYHVERKEKSSKLWMKANKSIIPSNSYKVLGYVIYFLSFKMFSVLWGSLSSEIDQAVGKLWCRWWSRW